MRKRERDGDKEKACEMTSSRISLTLYEAATVSSLTVRSSGGKVVSGRDGQDGQKNTHTSMDCEPVLKPCQGKTVSAEWWQSTREQDNGMIVEGTERERERERAEGQAGSGGTHTHTYTHTE